MHGQQNIKIHSTVIYISHYEYVLSLKMAVIAETCCRWLLTDEVVFNLDLLLFYCIVSALFSQKLADEPHGQVL